MENDFQKFFKDTLSSEAITKKSKEKKSIANSSENTLDTDETEKMDGNDMYEGGNGGNIDSEERPHKFLKPEEKTPSTKKSMVDLSKIEMFMKSGGAPFQIFVEKATVAGNTDGRMIVEGLATTTNVDHDQERMSPEAIKAMEDEINKNGVPLISEHSKEWDGVLGHVFKAWVDERNQLHVQAELDKDMSKSKDLYTALKKGAQLGLSIAGIVKKAGLEMVEGIGKKCKTFYDVLLKEVSVTNRPSNFDTWLIAKGIAKSREKGMYEKYLNTNSYQEYLKCNPKLDWQYAIAKSVQDDVLIESNMDEIKKDETLVDVKPAEEVKTEEVKVEEVAPAVEEVKSEEVKVEEVKVEEVKTEEALPDAEIEAEVTEQVAKAKKEAISKAVDEVVKSRVSAIAAKAKAIAMKHIENAFKAMGGEETETTEDAEETKECKSKKAIEDLTTEDTETETEVKSKKAIDSSMTDETEEATEVEAKAKKTKKAKPAIKDVAITTDTVEEETTEETEDEETATKNIRAIVAGVTANLEKKQMRIIGNLQEVVTKMMKTPNERKGIAIAMEKKFVGNAIEEQVEGGKVEKSEGVKKTESFQDYFKTNFSSEKK